MWTCSRCGTKVEEEFDVCWQCGTSIDGVEDPNFLDADEQEAEPLEDEPSERPEGWQRLVTVRAFRDPVEAHALKMRLEAAGVEVFLADAELIAMDWLLSNAVGGVKVQVAEADVDRVRDLIGDEE